MFELIMVKHSVRLSAPLLDVHLPPATTKQRMLKGEEGAPEEEPNIVNSRLRDALLSSISNSLGFRVMPNRGLVLAVADIHEVGEARLVASDPSAAWVDAVFSLVVFRPTIGERIRARILKQLRQGIIVTLDFVDSIFVPEHLLVENSMWDSENESWQVELDSSTYVPYEDHSLRRTTTDSDALSNQAPSGRGTECILAVSCVTIVDESSATGHIERLPFPLKNRGGLSEGSFLPSWAATPMLVTGSFSASQGLGPCFWYTTENA